MIEKNIYLVIILVICLGGLTVCGVDLPGPAGSQSPTLQPVPVTASPLATELPTATPGSTPNPTPSPTAVKPTASLTPTTIPTAPALVRVVAIPESENPVVEMPNSTVVPPGLAALNHPEAAKYIFLVDPAQWQIDQVGRWDFLAHKTLPGCRLDIVPPWDRLLRSGNITFLLAHAIG